MRNDKRIAVVIPAQNEADAIGKVVADVPDWVDQIIVADNGSSDDTAAVARAAGADVISELEPGYGAACLAGIAAAALRAPISSCFWMATIAIIRKRWRNWWTRFRSTKPIW